MASKMLATVVFIVFACMNFGSATIDPEAKVQVLYHVHQVEPVKIQVPTVFIETVSAETTKPEIPAVPAETVSAETSKLESTSTSTRSVAVQTDGSIAMNSKEFRRQTYSALTSGFSQLTLKSDFPTPYELLLVGPDAVPIATNKKGQVLIAASRFGKGKVVVLGHERYLHDPTFRDLLLNAVAWLKPNAASTVSLISKLSELTSLLQNAGQKVAVSDTLQSSTGVFCTDASVNTQAADLINFVESGGGLLIAGDASAWTGKDVITKAAVNKIVSVAGVYFTNQPASVGKALYFDLIPPQNRVYVSNLGDFKDDVATVLSGVDTLRTSWFVKPVVHGRLAFPIAYSKDKGIVVAGAYYGHGKVAVLTRPDQEKNTVFMTNLIGWLRSQQKGMIAIDPKLTNLKTVQDLVTAAGWTPVVSKLMTKDIAVYVTENLDETEGGLIHAFVAKGGSLLLAAEAFYWGKNNPKLSILDDYPVNKIISKFGISLTKDWEWGPWKADPNVSTPFDFRRFVDDLVVVGNLTVPEEHHKHFIFSSLQILKRKIGNDIQLNQLYLSLAKGLTTSSLKPPTPENKVQNINERLLWMLHAYAPSSINVVGVDASATAYKPWRSTGLYAPPGRAIVLRVPKAAVNPSLEIQIGCQSDDLWHAGQYPLKRYPVMIPENTPIDNETVTVFSKYGGLIYVTVKAPLSLGSLEFVVENADNAPYFKDGVTDPADWDSTVRFYSSPWAEIETKKMIMTVLSTYVKDLPSDTLLHTAVTWNRAMDAVEKLAARTFPHPERMVADVQISVGAMHSGYPIMGLEWRGAYMANASRMIAERYFWAFFHEIGHNLQQKVWDFPHSTEVTNNLWPVYVGEEVFGVDRSVAWGDGWTPEHRFNVTRNFIQSSTKLEGAAPELYLNAYLYLQEAFGWQPFFDVIAKYQSMLDLKLDANGVLNLWVKTFSQQVNRNLAPYFKKFKWPVTKELEQELSVLPEWKENPLNAIL